MNDKFIEISISDGKRKYKMLMSKRVIKMVKYPEDYIWNSIKEMIFEYVQKDEDLKSSDDEGGEAL